MKRRMRTRLFAPLAAVLAAGLALAPCGEAAAASRTRTATGSGGGSATRTRSADGSGNVSTTRSATGSGGNTATKTRTASATGEGSANVTTTRSGSVNSVNRSSSTHVDVHYDDHHSAWDDHPVATAAAVTGAVAVTAAVIGSIVYTPPPNCVPVNVGGVAYQQCGSTWYQPQYAGTQVQYVVVAPPK